MNYYIYIDDIRNDDSWFAKTFDATIWRPFICRTYKSAIGVLNWISGCYPEAGIVIDLDHDLGELQEMCGEVVDERTGYDICKFIVEHKIPLVGFHIHSMNPVGAENMRQILTHYGYKEFC